MKTNVANTSLLAYADLIEQGTIGPQEAEVLSCLNMPMTSRQIASHLDLERCAVTGRINSLIKKDLAIEYGTVICDISKRQVNTYARKTK